MKCCTKLTFPIFLSSTHLFRPTACKWLQQHDRIKKALLHYGPQWKVISQLYFWGTRSKHQLKAEYNSAAFKKLDADAEVEVAAGSEEGEATKTQWRRNLYARGRKNDGRQ